MSSTLSLLDPHQVDQPFPDISQALTEPNGLLAFGGCLSSQRLINAYYQGIFPWYNEDEPILWWSPDPRLILLPDQLHISKSLQKTLRKQHYQITFDTAFNEVIKACAQPRTYEPNTWLSTDMQQAYQDLHQQGHARSVEVWYQNELVGGIYGVAVGKVFFGESMFHRKTDASKVAFVALVQQLAEWGYELIDCQVHSPHLVSLGAVEIPRTKFAKLLHHYRDDKPDIQAWQNK